MNEVVVSSPDAGILNQAITELVSRTAPPQKAVSMLYERWSRYASSPARQRPEPELHALHQAFATAYVAIAKERGLVPSDLHPRVLALAGPELQRVQAGEQLDAQLARVDVKAPVLGGSATDPSGKVWKPLALIFGGLLAYKYLRPARGGKRG